MAKAATDELVARLKGAWAEGVVRYTVRPGEHGFDGHFGLEEGWVREGVEFVKGFWL